MYVLRYKALEGSRDHGLVLIDGVLCTLLTDKNILNHALEDVGFWYHHPEYKNEEKIVWLLLYDMQGRKFGRRGEVNEVVARERAFEAAGLKDIEDALLTARTRLAASVSRLRIGGSALNLGKNFSNYPPPLISP